jgi:hypothetical protein
MKQTLVIVVVLIVVVAALIFQRVKSRAIAPRTFHSTDEYIQFAANEAVKNADKEFNVKLDYSVDSIKKVEDVLGRLHDMYEKDKASLRVDALANMYGAYIGEVIRRSEPGVKWEKDHPVAGEKSYPLHWAARDLFPMAWCHRRITEGDGDNVSVKYDVLKQQAQERAGAKSH